MNCVRCGKELTTGSVFNKPMCRKCAVSITVKELIFRLILPLVGAYILYWFASGWFVNSSDKLILCALVVGLPFGFGRLRVWLFPGGGSSVAGSIGILLLNVLGGAIIGWAVLAYRVVTTIFLTIYRVFRLITYRPASGTYATQ